MIGVQHLQGNAWEVGGGSYVGIETSRNLNKQVTIKAYEIID